MLQRGYSRSSEHESPGWVADSYACSTERRARAAAGVPSGGLGPIFENLIASRLTEQGRRPNIIVQDTSLESVLSIVAAKRYISVATGASQGVTWSDLLFLDIHDPTGPARLEYALYWREDNDNPALQRFFKLIEERYPG